MPTELMDVDSAMIWASVSPTSSPVDASRVAISTMSASVVAKWFPRSTTTEPRRSQLLVPSSP